MPPVAGRVKRQRSGRRQRAALRGYRTASALWFAAEGAADFARRRHRAVRIAAFRFLLGDRPAAGLVRRVPVAAIVEGLFADAPRGIFGWRRVGVDGRVFRAVVLFGIGAQPVADTGLTVVRVSHAGL